MEEPAEKTYFMEIIPDEYKTNVTCTMLICITDNEDNAYFKFVMSHNYLYDLIMIDIVKSVLNDVKELNQRKLKVPLMKRKHSSIESDITEIQSYSKYQVIWGLAKKYCQTLDDNIRSMEHLILESINNKFATEFDENKPFDRYHNSDRISHQDYIMENLLVMLSPAQIRSVLNEKNISVGEVKSDQVTVIEYPIPHPTYDYGDR